MTELDLGRGKVIWSQLDLEDHATLDPAANRLAKQLLNYARTSALAPRTSVSYIGGAAGSALLKSLGLQFQTVTTLPATGLVVVGADATISDAQLETFARNGGKVLFLTRQNTQGAAGLQLQEKRISLVRYSLRFGPKPVVFLFPTCAGAMIVKRGLRHRVTAGKLALMVCWRGVRLEKV